MMPFSDHRERLQNLVIGVLADADYPSREQKNEAERELAAAIQQAIDDWVDANVSA